MGFQIKRIYEPAAPDDGVRILVDRLWPRGVSKERAALDMWEKSIAPSPPLRQWFCHKAELFDEFKEKYTEELKYDSEKQPLIADLINMAKKDTVTLLYGAKDPQINHAIILLEFLNSRLK